jgi:hypothetical protein
MAKIQGFKGFQSPHFEKIFNFFTIVRFYPKFQYIAKNIVQFFWLFVFLLSYLAK